MHTDTLNLLKHNHDFSVINKKGERRTKLVLALTFLTMILEITAGALFGSMALLADGWHMGTHVAAFMIAIIAYRYSRVHAHDHTFAFSAAKVGVLGGYTSSVALGVVALIMLIESGQRIANPHTIHFNEAIAVAGFGLFINLICALLLQDRHHHDHTHGHSHHHDHNLKAAYLHVLADALTSVLAIIALVLGKYYGWNWLDPIMGIVGALIIAQWSYSLMRETSPVLLDESIALKDKLAIKEKIESDADNRVSDLHIWRVGPGHFAIIISLVSHNPKEPEYYKELLKEFCGGGVNKLSHITIEVNRCTGDFCIE
ncbi:CDF family Co(II)/Ni(II) efflux transporter DmeF [Methylobacter sp.]|uniref:CDF family Co(II)/Ni(II) efflux transporter DmeF n=1 Tax=Methylobacter sp. TaxID=2051955 RepID=UPI001210B085|nr:CDF family Co(II)/Ni(II) efflux transporter DmeF [Methylobacter sp.]TAK62965.1 MAG: cation transporter [Methylobacter sp.]